MMFQPALLSQSLWWQLFYNGGRAALSRLAQQLRPRPRVHLEDQGPARTAEPAPLHHVPEGKPPGPQVRIPGEQVSASTKQCYTA